MASILPLERRSQVVFDRGELDLIMQIYGRMVAAGQWRDYAIELGREAAIFSAFRRAAERPEYRIVKDPRARARQGQYALVSEAGTTLRRGNDLSGVLSPLARKLLKLAN